MAFDPDAYLSSKTTGDFDPDAYLNDGESEDQGRPVQAAAEGFGKVATMGYLPQLQAATEPVTNAIMNHLPKSVKNALDIPDVDVQSDDYLKRRDDYIKHGEELKAENPNSYLAGEAGGMLSSGIATSPLTTAKGATALGRIANAAVKGGALGLAANPGDKEGEAGGLQVGDRLKNGMFGAAIGGGIQGAGEGIATAADKARAYLKMLANEKAVKATGAMKRDMENLGQDRVQAMGRQLLDDEIVTPLARPKTIMDRVQGKIGEYADDLSNKIKTADETLNRPEGFNMENATPDQIRTAMSGQIKTDDIKQSLIDGLKKEYAGVPETELAPAIGKIEAWFADRPDVMSVGELQQLKTSLNKFISKADYNKDLVGMSKEGLMSVRRGAKDAIEQKADAAASILGEAGGGIKDTNRKLGTMLEAEDLAADRVARDAANRSIGLTDTIAGAGAGGAAATIAGGPAGVLGALAGAGANKLGRMYGNSLMATGFDAFSNSLKNVPAFAKMSPGAFNEMAQSLYNKSQFEHAPNEQPIERDDKLLDMLSKNPSILNQIHNPKLRDALRRRMETTTSDKPQTPPYLKGPVSDEAAKQQFLNGN